MALKPIQVVGWLKDINDNFDNLGERGVHAATAGEATAGTLDGVLVTADAAVSLAAGVLTVADGAATYSVTEGDLVHWIVF